MRARTRSFGLFASVGLALLLAIGAHAQEGPADPDSDTAPTVRNSTSGDARAPLSAPLAVPPPGLEAADGGPVGRATRHLGIAEVLDGLGVRIARKLGGADCDLLAPGGRALSLALAEADAHATTAGALLADPGAPTPEALERWRAIDTRLAQLASTAAEVEQRSDRCRAGHAPPSLYLTPAESEPIDGLVAVFAQASAPHRVVWVDDTPTAVSGSDGWTLLVLSPGEHRLCDAWGDAAECRTRVVIEATMGAAFELSGD